MEYYNTRELHSEPGKAIWCPECCLRIAPYDLRTVSNGKDYHRHCFQKMVHQGRGVSTQALALQEEDSEND